MLSFEQRANMNRFLAALVICIAPTIGFATVAKQAPWAPEAAAYRLTLFMGNLSPVPWNKIENSWETPVAGASVAAPALSRLDAADQAKMRIMDATAAVHMRKKAKNNNDVCR